MKDYVYLDEYFYIGVDKESIYPFLIDKADEYLKKIHPKERFLFFNITQEKKGQNVFLIEYTYLNSHEVIELRAKLVLIVNNQTNVQYMAEFV